MEIKLYTRFLLWKITKSEKAIKKLTEDGCRHIKTKYFFLYRIDSFSKII
jgi:hypothetical protein